MDTDTTAAVAANRRNWDDRAGVHAASRFYDLARFREDPDHLSPAVVFDRTRLGDVAGQRLVHVQCHIGADTLSWARLGAARCRGCPTPDGGHR